MTPLIAAKYYRLVRWANYLQQDLVKLVHEGDSSSLEAFVPASFNMEAIGRALDGMTTGGKDGVAQKAKEKADAGKKAADKDGSGKSAPCRPVPSSTPVHPFARVDLRIGKIVSIEKHPQADRLYVEQVDLGEGPDKVRTVVSGLVEHVPIEQLQGRLCVFICNLKPASLCKVLSSAMLLVAKSEDGAALEPLIPPPGSQPGDRIIIDGVEGTRRVTKMAGAVTLTFSLDSVACPDEVIKPKESTWEDVRSRLRMIGGVAKYEDPSSGQRLPLLINRLGLAAGNITSEKVPAGLIS